MEQTFRADLTPIPDNDKNITVISNDPVQQQQQQLLQPQQLQLHHEEDSSTSSSTKKPTKRTPACAQCRRRKIGCDRLRPFCSNCVKYHKERCIYPEEDLEAFNEYINQPAVNKNHNDNNNHSEKSSDKAVGNNYGGNRATFEVNSMKPGNTNMINSNNTISSNFNDMSTTFSVQRMPMQAPLMVPSSSSSQFPVNTAMIPSGLNTQSASRATTMSPMQNVPLNPTIQLMNNNESSSVMKMEQQLKFHNVQNAPVYEPPVLVQLPVAESPKVVKPSKTKNLHHGQHHNAIHSNNNLKSVAQPKNVVSMEDIGAYNTKTHMLKQLKYWERKQKALPIANSDPTEYSVMQSTYKQKDLLLKEMKHLKYRFIELQERRRKTFPQNVTKVAYLKKIPVMPILQATITEDINSKNDTINSNEDNSGQLIRESYLGSVSGAEKLTITNLHSNTENKLGGDLLLKDTPNTIFTINYMANRDTFLAKYYNKLQTYIILNFKEQLTQYKQKQFNATNKQMGNSPIENDLLNRLLEKLFDDIDRNDRGKHSRLSGFNEFLFSILEVDNMDIQMFKERLLSQMKRAYQDSACTTFKNYFSEVSKFGTLLIVLIIYLMDNSIGKDPEIEVLNRKLSHIVNEIESINDKTILFEDLSIIKFLSLKNLYYDIFEDDVRSNNTNYNQDVYLSQNFQSNQMTADMKFSIYSHYMTRNAFIGSYPSLVSIDMLEALLLECKYPVIRRKAQTKFWETLNKITGMIQNQNSTNMSSIKELMEHYVQFEQDNLGINHPYDDGDRSAKNGIPSILEIESSLIMRSIYERCRLFINYYLLLEYEKLKLHDRFNKVLCELSLCICSSFKGQLIRRDYLRNLDNFDGSKTMFNKNDLIDLEIVCEMLFSLGLRLSYKPSTTDSMTISPENDNNPNDISVAISVVKDKIRKILIQIILSLKNNKTRKLRTGHNIMSKRLEKKLLNFVKTLSEEDGDNNNSNMKLNNGITLLNLSEITKFSEEISSISDIISSEENDNTFHLEYKVTLDIVQDDLKTHKNSYGLTNDSFSSVFGAMFQK